MDCVGSTLFIGADATLAMELWTFGFRRLFGTPLADCGLVGRWFAQMARSRFRHARIAALPPAP